MWDVSADEVIPVFEPSYIRIGACLRPWGCLDVYMVFEGMSGCVLGGGGVSVWRHEGCLGAIFESHVLSVLDRSRDRDGDWRSDRRSSRERDEDRERFRSRRGRSASPSQRDKPPADEPPVKKRKEELDPILTRTGGAYIPPAKLRMMQAQITDKSRSGMNTVDSMVRS